MTGTYFPHFLLAGAAGWGAANQLGYSYDDFIDTVQEEDLSKHLSASAQAAPTRVKRHLVTRVPIRFGAGSERLQHDPIGRRPHSDLYRRGNRRR